MYIYYGDNREEMPYVADNGLRQNLLNKNRSFSITYFCFIQNKTGQKKIQKRIVFLPLLQCWALFSDFGTKNGCPKLDNF